MTDLFSSVVKAPYAGAQTDSHIRITRSVLLRLSNALQAMQAKSLFAWRCSLKLYGKKSPQAPPAVLLFCEDWSVQRNHLPAIFLQQAGDVIH